MMNKPYGASPLQRQRELDAFEEQRQAYNTAMRDFTDQQPVANFDAGGEVRKMYLEQTGREADPGGLKYFVTRFGEDGKIDKDELDAFRTMAGQEVVNNDARKAAAASEQAAQQAAASEQAAQQAAASEQAAQQAAASEQAAQQAAAQKTAASQLAALTAATTTGQYSPPDFFDTSQAAQDVRRKFAEQLSGATTGATTSSNLPTLTTAIANDLMLRSMTTGAPTAEFDRYGGYAKVKALYEQGGGQLNLDNVPKETLTALAQTVAKTGVGDLEILKKTGVPLSMVGFQNMLKNGIDPASAAAYMKQYGTITPPKTTPVTPVLPLPGPATNYTGSNLTGVEPVDYSSNLTARPLTFNKAKRTRTGSLEQASPIIDYSNMGVGAVGDASSLTSQAVSLAKPTLFNRRLRTGAARNPSNYFAYAPETLTGLAPGTVALGSIDTPLAAAKTTLNALGDAPNLSPGMLGGVKNTGYRTDRLGNRIYAPGAAPLFGFAKGGDVDLQALLAQNNETLSDDEPEESINTDPLGAAQKMMANFNSTSQTNPNVSPVRKAIKQTKPAPAKSGSAKMAYESLVKGDLGAMGTAAPALKDTDSAQAQMQELARIYRLKAQASQERARGLSANTFGAPTLEQPTLTKGKLTSKRFNKGGEAKKSGVVEDIGRWLKNNDINPSDFLAALGRTGFAAGTALSPSTLNEGEDAELARRRAMPPTVDRSKGSPEGGEAKKSEGELSQEEIDAASRPAFGNPNIARQVARTKALQADRSNDVNTLPDPQTYAFAQGMLGEAPDQMGFSPTHPDYKKIIGRGEQGMVTGGVSMLGPAAKALKALTKASVKTVKPAASAAFNAAQDLSSGTERMAIAQRNAALPIEQGGLGLPANNTAMDRAAAMGFDTDVFHGTSKDFLTFNPDKEIFAAELPEIANLYGKYRKGDGQRVMPLKIRGKQLTISDMDDAGKNNQFGYNLAKKLNLSDDEIEKLLIPQVRYPNGELIPGVKNSTTTFSDLGEREIINRLPKYGIDRLKVIDMDDMGGPQTQYMLPAGSDNVRSRFAAYDPFRRTAAVAAAMGVAAPNLLAGQEVKRSKGSPEEGETSIKDQLIGAGETALTLGSGALSSVVGMPYGLYKGLTSGKYLEGKAPAIAEKEAQAFIERNTYVPRSTKGRENLEAINSLMEQSKLPPILPETMMLRSIPRAAVAAQGERIGMATEKALDKPVTKVLKRGGKSAEMLKALSAPPSYAVRPTGSTMLTGPVGLDEDVGKVNKIVQSGISNARFTDQADLIKDFWDKKARNYFTRQFGTPDDPIVRGIADKTIKGSALEKMFPRYLVDSIAVGKTRYKEGAVPEGFVGPGAPVKDRFFPKYPEAMEDLTRSYDEATGLRGNLIVTDPAAANPDYNHTLSGVAKDMAVRSGELEADKMIGQGVDPRLINSQVGAVTRAVKDPSVITSEGTNSAKDLYQAFEAASLYKKLTPEKKIDFIKNMRGEGVIDANMSDADIGKNLLSENVLTAIEKGEPVYDTSSLRQPLADLFRPEDINNYLTSLPPRELANIRFEDAVRGSLKLKERTDEYKNLDARIRAGKPVAEKFFSEGLSKPLLQFDKDSGIEGFAWKRIEKREATVPEGAYIGHSVGGYEMGGPGYKSEKMEGFNTGKYRVYTLRDNRNRPVTTIEVKMEDANTPVVTQIKGNGRATGNVPAAKYENAVLEFLQGYLKPKIINEDEGLLTPLLQSYQTELQTVRRNEIADQRRQAAIEDIRRLRN